MSLGTRTPPICPEVGGQSLHLPVLARASPIARRRVKRSLRCVQSGPCPLQLFRLRNYFFIPNVYSAGMNEYSAARSRGRRRLVVSSWSATSMVALTRSRPVSEECATWPRRSAFRASAASAFLCSTRLAISGSDRASRSIARTAGCERHPSRNASMRTRARSEPGTMSAVLSSMEEKRSSWNRRWSSAIICARSSKCT